MNLEEYTKEDLQEELNKREEKIRETIPVPLKFERKNYAKLGEVCREHLAQIKAIEFTGPDDEHEIYRAAMKAEFGEDVFIWIDNQMIS